MKAILLLAFQFALFAFDSAAQSTNSCGAAGNPTGSPIGGGQGYLHIVDSAMAFVKVSSKQQLINALNQAVPGNIIYVVDTAEIDLTGTYKLKIPKGVTLASGRGKNGSLGALIYVKGIRPKGLGDTLFFIDGDSVRVTGIRLRGPDIFVGLCGDCMPVSKGILCDTHNYLEVDNCELWGWSHYALGMKNSIGDYIHHNYIHDCLRFGYGYGVSHDGFTQTIIEANKFNSNRHSIAGSGSGGQNYEAIYNIVGACTYKENQAFDMHHDVNTCFAGNTILINHNTFLLSQASLSNAVKIRGNPRDIAIIKENLITFDSFTYAFLQQIDHDYCQGTGYNFSQSLNCYNTNLNSTCIPQILDSKDGFCQHTVWSSAGNGNLGWFVGDFNGDGKDDLGRYIDINQGSDGFQVLLSNGISFQNPIVWSPAGVGNLTWFVGDFNGDGKDDLGRYIDVNQGSDGFQVLLSTGHSFQNPVVWSGAGVGNLTWFVGDFNGDGKDDIGRYIDENLGNDGFQVLLSTGHSFQNPVVWSPAGVGDQSWYIGDFNGDGKADIFSYNKGTCKRGDPCSSSADVFLSTGTSFQHSGSWSNVENDVSWPYLNSFPNSKWYIGDFNADGADDIFRYLPGVSGAQVFLSNKTDEFVYDGNWTRAGFGTGWTLGDFNGDGRCDISGYNPGQSGADVFLSCISAPLFYKSRQTGNWNDINTWESSPLVNFSAYVVSPARVVPYAGNSLEVTVRNSNIVTITENTNSRKTTVNTNGKLLVNPDVKFLIVQ